MDRCDDVTFKFDSCIRDYHQYQEIWTPILGEILCCSRELGNRHDPFCVKVVKEQIGTVGHVPKKISSTCSMFLQLGGTIMCTVAGNRRYSWDLIQGGMEILCILILKGKGGIVDRAKKLLQFCQQKNTVTKTDPNITVDETPPKKIKVEGSHEITGQNSNKLERNLSESQLLHHDRCKIQLDSDDRNAIIHGQRLNNKHINYAQSLLSDKFPDVAELKSTLLQQKIRLDSSRPFVQILHVHNDHWITVSNLCSETGVVYIYDSVYNSISSEVRQLIDNMCGLRISVVMYNKMPKQIGATDCGIYAIATATALLHGVNPTSYNQSSLRSHLVTCFESCNLTSFT